MSLNDEQDIVTQEHKKKKQKLEHKMGVVKINNKNWYFNMNYVLELEPNTTLFELNAFSSILTKKFNQDGVLEYMLPIDHFDFISDYLKGYTFHVIIKKFVDSDHLQKNINNLLITLTNMKMNNLYSLIHNYFPIVMVESQIFMINLKKLQELEPCNALLQKTVCIGESKVKYIFRDITIFKEYIYPYMNGLSSLETTLKLIKECQKTDVMFYNKMCEDIKYFNLQNLLSYI